MFCDDANGLVMDLGHSMSYTGFIGEETPSYSCDSHYMYRAGNQSETSFLNPSNSMFKRYFHNGIFLF